MNYLRTRHRMPWGVEPRERPVEFVPRTEHEEARRSVRDWLRDRDESNTDEFDDESREDATT